MRGLAFDRARLVFYIKPADGFQLPRIMQWVKQTFSVRFNIRTGRLAVMHLSSVADSMPPHRGAVFKQRPHRFGRSVGWAMSGGDRYWSEILPGEPPPGAGEVDWAAVEKMANKRISAVIGYELSWVCPRTGLGKAETRFSPQNPAPSG
jgi:hypothetical protein